MTDPVRIRMWEPIEDLRDWLEKHIYAPTGWCPALNSLGEISPVSQIAPVDATGLTVITDAVTEPTPDWDAGQRVINIVRVVYKRDYSLGPPDPPPLVTQVVRQNLIDEREISQEFRDEASITRHGEQAIAYDGQAFRAIGREPTAGEESTLSTTSIPVYRGMITYLMTEAQFWARVRSRTTETTLVKTGAHIIPVSGDIADETGYQLFQLRKIHVLNRYTLGAPAISIPVMRAFIPDHRCGDWVVPDLSWLPNYITQRRGLQTLAQIVALGDLDCAWRRLLVEQVIPVAES